MYVTNLNSIDVCVCVCGRAIELSKTGEEKPAKGLMGMNGIKGVINGVYRVSKSHSKMTATIGIIL